MPRQRMVTMPTCGFERDARVSRISLSAHRVSPTNTGFGSLTSVHPRLAAAFSLVEAAWDFAKAVSVGIFFGLLVAVVIREVRRRLDDPPVEITISILSGYAAYVPAEHFDAVDEAATWLAADDRFRGTLVVGAQDPLQAADEIRRAMSTSRWLIP